MNNKQRSLPKPLTGVSNLFESSHRPYVHPFRLDDLLFGIEEKVAHALRSLKLNLDEEGDSVDTKRSKPVTKLELRIDLVQIFTNPGSDRCSW
jgi:hypothetical protein